MLSPARQHHSDVRARNRAGRPGVSKTLSGALLALAVVSGARTADAQRIGPDACGQDAASADYGGITVGTEVVPQRHRYLHGDPNWDAEMGRFLGRAAVVTRMSGVDDAGCPGVRLDVDGGGHFWRVRDITVGTARPNPTHRAPASAREAPFSEGCGQTDATADYGPFEVGELVQLGRHDAVDGDENWMAPMSEYVGRTARITEHAGVDDAGCPGVLVDADGGHWFWRVRSLTRLLDDRTDMDLATAHGRTGVTWAPATSALAAAPAAFEQACGMSDETVRYGVVEVGSAVTLGRHRPVDGEDNWVAPMDGYVGRRAHVTGLLGVDEQGCPLLSVDIDHGDWLWRLRDLQP